MTRADSASTSDSVPSGTSTSRSASASTSASSPVLERLADVIATRRGGDPDRSYVARLFSRGNDAILKKIGEEATETVMAAKDGVSAHIVAETADLWFHCLVMLEFHGIRPERVLEELVRREGLSGLEEKALRKAEAREEKGE